MFQQDRKYQKAGQNWVHPRLRCSVPHLAVASPEADLEDSDFNWYLEEARESREEEVQVKHGGHLLGHESCDSELASNEGRGM